MIKFWDWIKNETTGERTLYFDGVISDSTWWGDEITPAMFRKELFAGSGDVTIWINSPGGDCIAASQIYSMLIEYTSSKAQGGNITVKIDGLAASAASVIAMAGTKIFMFPTAMMMIHNPLTIAIGDSEEMKKTIEILDEFKESIINAYESKTGQERDIISNMMDAETWMSAHKAVELGFADGIAERTESGKSAGTENYTFSRKAVTNSLIDKVRPQINKKPVPNEQGSLQNVGGYYDRLYKSKT